MTRYIALVFGLVCLMVGLAFKLPPPPTQESLRRDVAAQTFEFLRKHALPFEGDPSQWAYSGAYEMHLAAKRLYDLSVPLREIAVPVSLWGKGGYTPWWDPKTGVGSWAGFLVYNEHEALLLEIKSLIDYGLKTHGATDEVLTNPRPRSSSLSLPAAPGPLPVGPGPTNSDTGYATTTSFPTASP